MKDTCDVTIAIRDVSLDIARHTAAGTAPDRRELIAWLESLNSAARAYQKLEHACEDIVEEGTTSERIEAMKVALTHAQGQISYWMRKDRW